MEAIDMRIAKLNRTKDGYSGHVRTLMIDAAIVLVPAAGDGENAPSFRVHLDEPNGPEIGAAWKHAGEKAGDYLSLQIDDPTFAHPIRANLFQAEEKGSAFDLGWHRPSRREAQIGRAHG